MFTCFSLCKKPGQKEPNIQGTYRLQTSTLDSKDRAHWLSSYLWLPEKEGLCHLIVSYTVAELSCCCTCVKHGHSHRGDLSISMTVKTTALWTFLQNSWHWWLLRTFFLSPPWTFTFILDFFFLSFSFFLIFFFFLRKMMPSLGW